jgi:hypothetical protein
MARPRSRKRAARPTEGIDLSVLRENLRLSCTERIRRASLAANGITSLREAVAKARQAGK